MERLLNQLKERTVSRRSFLGAAAITGAGTVLAGCGSSKFPPTTTVVANPFVGTNFNDADFLNFALNLEYLEAEFYLHAATGSGLTATDSGNSTSLTTGGSQVVGATALEMQYIYEIAQNELDHVRLLRSALGSSAVAAPAINLSTSFNTLATAAGLGATFNPFASYSNYLIGAFIFEDVGVTAYHGAIRYLTSSANVTAAAQIHAVEAYHAASIRSQIVASGSALVATANAVVTVRSTLGGAEETMLSGTSIVAANATTSIGWERTTDQVLHIVYGTGGTAGVSKGLFFPNGLNGTITSTLA